jgi:hypothetical protein
MTPTHSQQLIPNRHLAHMRNELRHRSVLLGFDPDDQERVLDLAAVAITHLAWLGSPIKVCHAASSSQIDNTTMMRTTAAITRRTRRLLAENRTGPGPAQSRKVMDTATLFDAVTTLMTDPQLRLADGRTLNELARDRAQLDAFTDHVHRHADQWTALADCVGLHTAVLMLAARAATTCRRWWLGPDWPYLVEEFTARLKDPARWGDPTMVTHLRTLVPPPQATDPERLRNLLLAGPDLLDTDTDRYCLHAGLGRLLPHHYNRPPDPRLDQQPSFLILVEPPPAHHQ